MVRVTAAIVAAAGLSVKRPSLALCEPVVEEPVYLADYARSERKWDTHKGEADAIEAGFLDSPVDKLRRWGERIHECAQSLHYAWVEPKDGVELGFKLKSTWFCRVRLCPICQWRRTLMWYARFMDALPGIVESYEPSGVSFIYLTLTVRNCPVEQLRSTLGSMGKAWIRYMHRKEFGNILGWIRTTEVTRSEDSAGSAHPHYHVLLLVRNSWFKKHFVRHEQWRRAWKESARLDYDPQVRVNKVRPGLKGIEKAALETFKYSVKPADGITNVDWLRELALQMDRLRVVASGGVLKDALKERQKETQEDLLGVESKAPEREYGRVSFDWEWVDGKYKRRA